MPFHDLIFLHLDLLNLLKGLRFRAIAHGQPPGHCWVWILKQLSSVHGDPTSYFCKPKLITMSRFPTCATSVCRLDSKKKIRDSDRLDLKNQTWRAYLIILVGSKENYETLWLFNMRDYNIRDNRLPLQECLESLWNTLGTTHHGMCVKHGMQCSW